MSTDKKSWNWASARHLLNRAGFGGTPAEIAAFTRHGLDSGLESLFDFKARPLERPEWLSDYDRVSWREFRSMSREERQEWNRKNRQRVHELQISWLNRMIDSPDAAAMLRDKMTLFWHSHFATSAQKVNLPPLLFAQLGLFHKHAVGNFRKLLHGVSRDPAMLRYLDNNQNRKGKPNENFARELMELFSLGPGNYSEADIQESARAFTGWSNDPLHFTFRRRVHDYGRKFFLGESGNFDGEDIVNIILEQPACSEFITRKLLNFFSFEVSDKIVRAFAKDFRENDYEIKPLLKKVFSHEEFYSLRMMGIQIKSPIQLVVGTARTLDIEMDNDQFLLYMLNLMGQVPYLPPNVKGWPGGRSWIDTSRLLTRYTFAEIVGRGQIPAEIDPRSRRDRPRNKISKQKTGFKRMMRRGGVHIEFDPRRLLTNERDASEVISRLAEGLLSHDLNETERASLLENYNLNLNKLGEHQALKRLIGDMMSVPAYQLC